MKKPHRLYKHYFRADVYERRHQAWRGDTIPKSANKKKLRLQFRLKLVSFYVLLPALMVWAIIAPYWERFDLAVDNFVGGFKRITLGFWSVGSLFLMSMIIAGVIWAHLSNWSLIWKLSMYFSTLPAFMLLAVVFHRSTERCVWNFCSDMQRWED